MADHNVEGLSFEQIFDMQGVAEELRNPDDYFFHTVSSADLDPRGVNSHMGEVYAVPRELSIKGVEGVFAMRDNGALIAEGVEGAYAGSDADIAARVIVHANASLERRNVSIGRASIIGAGTRVISSDIGPNVVIGESGVIHEAIVGEGTSIGKRADIKSGARIEDAVTIGEGVTFETGVSVGTGSVLGDGVTLSNRARLAEKVEMGDYSRVDPDGTIRRGAYVMPGQFVGKDKTIRTRTIVYPRRFKRGRKSSKR